MNKKDLIEKGIHYSASQHWKATGAKPQRGNTPIQLNSFAEFLNKLVKKQPMVEGYINTLYNEGKDIMYVYRLYQTSRLHPYEKTKTFADYMFATRDNIKLVTTSTHNTLSEVGTNDDVDYAI